MLYQISRRLFILGLFLLTLTLVSPVLAAEKREEIIYSPTVLEQEIGDEISFELLGFREQVVTNGAGDGGASLAFSIPAHWELTSDAELILDIQKAIYDNNIQVDYLSGGQLSISLNNVPLDTVLVNENGRQTLNIKIPADTLQGNNGRYRLQIELSNNFNCNSLQTSSVTLLPTSRFILPHTFVEPTVNLEQFPYPIQQGSFLPDEALFILPDSPSAAVLESALIASAGFGRVMNKTNIQILSYSDLTDEMRASQHLILIGRAEDFPQIDIASFAIDDVLSTDKSETSVARLEATDSATLSDAVGLEDGILQMALSPWNNAKIILMVSGNSDEGLIKAANAISYGTIRTGTQRDAAIANDIYFSEVVEPVQSEVRTFDDLNYGLKTLNGPNTDSTNYNFFVAPGATVREDETAVFSLKYSHSALINYEQSGANILLNNIPIGSVRLREETTRMSELLVEIPPTLLQEGDNTISVQATLTPLAECGEMRTTGSWFTIYPQSALHLPLQMASIEKSLPTVLRAYPQPFSFNESLEATAFVLPNDDIMAWSMAFQIAFDLGRQVDSDLLELQVAFADDVADSIRETSHLFIIGQATTLPIIAEINEQLPSPFLPNSNRIQTDRLPVEYEIPADVPLGYLQLLPSPWSAEHNIILVMGDSDAGLQNAVDTLLNSRKSLNGDLAVIEPETLFVTMSPVEEDILAEGASESEVIEAVVDEEVTTANGAPSVDGADESDAISEADGSEDAVVETETAVSKSASSAEEIDELDGESENDEQDEAISNAAGARSKNAVTRQNLTLPIAILIISLLALGGLGFQFYRNRS